MNRRKFIRNGSLMGMSITAWSISSCNQTTQSVATKPAAGSGDGFELNEITIDQLQQKMKEGSYTSRSVTDMYLKRINEIDKQGPSLHAVIEINPDAVKIADQMDAERKAGKLRGPLHGIPVLIKDNINSGDGMMTTAGSLSLMGNKAGTDAFIVKQLRDAGAVLLGKTNLSEWANFRSTRSSSGWSSRGGQTKNPYILDRSPSGSSSGSGAAVVRKQTALLLHPPLSVAL
jgi:amidase